MASSAPTSARVWIIAAGIGFAVMTTSAWVEAYRSRKGRVMDRLGALMQDWE